MLQEPGLANGSFLLKTALTAADQIIQWGDLARLEQLFCHDRLCHELQTPALFRLVVKQWRNQNVIRHNWDPVFDLVKRDTGRLVEEKWGNELLCIAAGAGCMPIAKRLLDAAQDNAALRHELLHELLHEPEPEQPLSPISWSPHQSIGEAVLGNHVHMVAFLLGEPGIEAHLRHRNCRGENVLHLASRACNSAVFRLLVPRFPD
jgi:hypothetical protein